MAKRFWDRVPRSGGFFWKLYGTYVAVALVSTLAIGAMVFEFFANNAVSNLRLRLVQMAELLASLEAANPNELWSPIAQNRVDELSLSSGAAIDIYLADGRVVASTDPRSPDRVELVFKELAQARKSGLGEASRPHEASGSTQISFAKAIVIRSEHIGYVRVSKTTDSLAPAFASLVRKIGLGCAFALAVSLAGGIYFARTVTTPLESIEEGCLRIAAGDLETRIENRRRDEFGTVAGTVNDMANSLADQLRRTEQQRNRSELLLRLLIDAVIAVDKEGRILFLNAAAQAYCESHDEDAVGQQFASAIAVEPVRNLVARALKEHKEFHETARWKDASQQCRYASLYVSPLEADEHELSGILLVARDTTEARRFELLRRDFASNVSHELKTPVTAIAALIEALEQGAIEEPALRRSFLERIRLQNQRMGRLVEELLVISRLESGKSILELKRCDARDAIKLARETFQPIAAFRGIEFRVEMPATEVPVNGDSRALEVMVNCLVDNALKFTPKKGQVAVGIGAARGKAMIQVSDTGPGVPESQRERVFERFYRLDASRSREGGGSGLGLSIVKHLAIGHGGEVELRSELGKGSCFVVTLPLA